MATLDHTQWQPCDPTIQSILLPLYKRRAGRPWKNRIDSMPQDKERMAFSNCGQRG